LHKLQLLGLEDLLRNTLRVFLTTEAEGPQLLAKLGGVLVEESRKLDLKGFDIRLFVGKPHVSSSTCEGDQEIAPSPQRRQTYIARALKQVGTQLNNNIILIAEDLRYALVDPSTALLDQPLDA
jgi:hypothetical protein